jgi:hypothetical protein
MKKSDKNKAHMVVRLSAYAPAGLYALQDDSWYSFLLEAELTPGPYK